MDCSVVIFTPLLAGAHSRKTTIGNFFGSLQKRALWYNLRLSEHAHEEFTIH